jgi:tetratricopeptide (TPR) repeat protein
MVVLITVVLLFGINSARAQSQSDLAKAQELLIAGNSLLQSGNFEQAVAKFTQVIEIIPTLAVGYINRGVALAPSNPAAALADAEKALELAKVGPDPDTYLALAHQVRGQAFYAQKQNQKSVEAFTAAINLRPMNPRFRLQRGLSYLALDQNELALGDFSKSIDLDPAFSQAYSNRAVVHRRNKKYDLALNDLETTLRLNPNDSIAYLNKGNVELDQRKLSDAVQSYSKAIAINPKADYFYNRARAHLDRGDLENSISDNSQAISLTPSHDKAYVNRAIAYNKSGKNDLAIADIRKSLQLRPDSNATRYILAFILLRSGKLVDARSEAGGLISKFPKWQAPYLVRAEAAAALGDLAAAKKDRTMAKQLDPSWQPDEPDFLIFEMTNFYLFEPNKK